MPRVQHLQTNFTAGEIGPKMLSRVDIARYANGAKRLRNVLPQVLGGVRRRDGTLLVREVRDSAQYSRLLPFIFNESTAYVIEFSADYLRFFKDGAVLGAPYEVSVGTNSEAQRRAMDYTQGADTMFWFHDAFFPRTLVRLADTNWTFGNMSFINQPYQDSGSYPLATLTPAIAGVEGAAQNFTASVSVFVAGDVGSYIKINGGVAKITAYGTGTVITVKCLKEFAVTAANQETWSLHAPAWSVSRGYPRTGAFHEQRLVMGGSPASPQTIWGSATGAYRDMGQATDDDSPFSFTFASDQVSPIQYLASGRSLMAFASGGEFTVTGGLEKPLAPTNVQIKQRSNYGTARVRPVKLRDAELFVQRAGKKVRAFAYNGANDDWTAPDISVLADHIAEVGLVDAAWQQEPVSVVWLVTALGELVSITFDPDQQVTAWAPHDVGGLVESITVIPSATGDQLWLVVKRTVGVVEKRYIERMTEAVSTDCSVSYAGPITTLTGLDHLEGLSADVVAAGVYVGRFTVTGGSVTLPSAMSSVVAGLPFTSEAELLPPELAGPTGTAKGTAMRSSKIIAEFYETAGGQVNGKDLIFRRFGEAGPGPELFTGQVAITNLGWARGASPIVFTQDKPMPWHLLSVTRVLTSNTG